MSRLGCSSGGEIGRLGCNRPRYRSPVTSDRLVLRQTFDSVADLYDRARPGYPPPLLDDLDARIGLGPGTRILEIGPGTGQLTVPLAERGARITAVELGADLAAVARDRTAGFPAVEVVRADFETWSPPAQPYDLVVAATAFHWLDRATRMARVARVLRPGGLLAVIETHHIAGGTPGFFAEVQGCYLRYDPRTTAEEHPLRPEEVAGEDVSGPGFAAPEIRSYEWELTSATAAYLDILRTYSSTLSLPEATAEALLGCIGDLIDKYGGTVTKRYLTRMQLVTRTA
jgi:SAM-dependent methyltransferase